MTRKTFRISGDQRGVVTRLFQQHRPINLTACNQVLIRIFQGLQAMAERHGPAFQGIAHLSEKVEGLLVLDGEEPARLLYDTGLSDGEWLRTLLTAPSLPITHVRLEEAEKGTDEKEDKTDSFTDHGPHRLFRLRPRVFPTTFKTRWAASAGFTLREVSGDGNCFFTAITTLLNNKMNLPTLHTPVTVRAAAIAHLRKHEGTFNQGFGVGMELGTFEDYCTRMEENGVWAEGPIIQATAACFNISLTMIDLREDEAGEAICHPIHFNEEAGEHAFTVLRTGEEIRPQHYDVLEPMEALQPRAQFG